MGLVELSLMYSGCGKNGLNETTQSSQLSHSIREAPSANKSEQTRTLQFDDWFEDRTEPSGIDFTFQSGRNAGQFTILETVGGGLGLIDLDLDARADVFTVGGGAIHPSSATPVGAPCALFRNLGQGQFTEISQAAQVVQDTDYSHGIQAADFNEDGFPDLFLTCFGRCRLLMNQGDGTFADVTSEAGLDVTGWHTAAAFGDFDHDGDLDLFITQYVDWRPELHRICQSRPSGEPDICPPQIFAPLPDRLFLNQGDGTFLDATKHAGVRSDGKGLGVLAADFNGDGITDIYVANDVVANHLYLGGPEFPWREVGETSGVAFNALGTPEGSMGVDIEDLDGDSLPELFVTNFELEDNSLYRNLGQGQYQQATTQFGLAGVGRPLVGFGTGFHDFNADGRPDLFILNGHVLYHSTVSPFRQPALLLQNGSNGRFADITKQAGPWFSVPHAARGGAVADLDDDGALDLVISSLDEPVTLLKNRLSIPRWIRVRLIGTVSLRFPIGARVTAQIDGKPVTRLLKSGGGYLSQSDPRILYYFPEGTDTAELDVKWPSGASETFELSSFNRDLVLVEGGGRQ